MQKRLEVDRAPCRGRAGILGAAEEIAHGTEARPAHRRGQGPWAEIMARIVRSEPAKSRARPIGRARLIHMRSIRLSADPGWAGAGCACRWPQESRCTGREGSVARPAHPRRPWAVRSLLG